MDTTEDSFFVQPTTDNTTTEFQQTTQYKVSSIILFIGCTVVLVGLNALVVFSFIFKRIPRTLPNFYMFQLAIADGATGLSMPVNMFSSIFDSLSKSTPYCRLETLSALCCMMASPFCILGLTIDRLQALRNPLLYNPDMTTRKYVTSTMGVWLLPVTVYFILPLFWFNDLEDTPLKTCYTVYILKREFTAYVLLPGIFVISTSVIVAYVPILKIVIQQSRAIRAVAVDQTERNMKSQLRVLKTATMVFLPYFAGCTPWCLLAAAVVYDEHEYNSPGTKFKVMQYMVFPVILTSGINPIIYATRIPEYRRAFKACLGCHAQVTSIT